MRSFFRTAALLAIFCAAARADLDSYIAAKDASYKWSRIAGRDDGPMPYAELRLVSQTWRQIAWKHRLMILRPPNTRKATQALLLISGGSWRDGMETRPLSPTSGTLRTAMAAATAVQMPVAVLEQVPFQPLYDGLTEDRLIAHTFDQYLNGGEDDWPLLLPMTKAAVRAMDAVQEFAAKEWQLEIQKFVVTGASKRGWTTWLAGAADNRVVAIAPMVIDVLNMSAQMKHQLATYGAYSEQIADYTRLKIQDRMDTEAGRRLLSIVDPWSYRQRLKMPKLILLGTNDPYWTLDSLNLYYDSLVGEKYILYIPNAGHGLGDMQRILSDIAALSASAAGKLRLPKFTWEMQQRPGAAQLAAKSDLKPAGVVVWLADSPTKDFRKARWRCEPLEAIDGRYVRELKAPQRGRSAMFAEATYDIDGRRLYLCTQVHIVAAPAQPPP